MPTAVLRSLDRMFYLHKTPDDSEMSGHFSRVLNYELVRLKENSASFFFLFVYLGLWLIQSFLKTFPSIHAPLKTVVTGLFSAFCLLG